MKKLILPFLCAALSVGPAVAGYIVVDDQLKHGAPGSVAMTQGSVGVHYQDANHRVIYINFTLTNNGSQTYYDLRFVAPYTWQQMNTLSPTMQAAGWVDAQYQWVNPDYNGNNGAPDGLFIKTYDGSDDPLESAMLMSGTNIPTTSPWGPADGYETTGVLAGDQVPGWIVAASLAPGQAVSFKIYLDYERRGAAPPVYGVWFDGYVVAVPEPSFILLIGMGFGVACIFARRFKA